MSVTAFNRRRRELARQQAEAVRQAHEATQRTEGKVKAKGKGAADSGEPAGAKDGVG